MNKKINIEGVYLENADLGRFEWIDRETDPSILKSLNLEAPVKELATELCDADEVFVYVTLVKATDNGLTEFSISMLSHENELDETNMMRIREMGLDRMCQVQGNDQPEFFEGYSGNMDLILKHEEIDFLLSLFEFDRRDRFTEALICLLKQKEYKKFMPEITRWYDESLEEVREKAQTLSN